MSTISKLTRALYKAARISNEARVIERTITGHPVAMFRHERNKIVLKALGKFLRR